MNLKKKQISKWLANWLVVTFFVGLLSYPISANAESVSIMKTSSSSEEKEELTEVTKKVKQKVTIPSLLTEFDYYMQEEEENNRIWVLVWNDKEESQSLRVSADSKGRIISCRLIDKNNANYAPKFQKSKLRKKADQFITQTSPELKGKYTYIESTFEGTYSGCYFYHYQRIENGILMPDNQIQVGINYETGKVIEYHVNWNYNLFIPNSKTGLTKKDAKDKIRKKLKMNLSYQTVYDDDKEKQKAYLVYTPSLPYVSVDAKNGVLYTSKYDENSSNKADQKETATEEAEDAGGNLSQEEINAIDKIKDIITKEQAIKKIKDNKMLLLDSNLTDISASLSKGNGKEESYIWNIEFDSPKNLEKADNNNGRYAFAAVDAKTGKILSYYITMKYGQAKEKAAAEASLKYTKDECQKTFETFAKEQLPSYMKETIKGEIKKDYILAYTDSEPVYGGYEYWYDRVYKKIPYDDNYITGSVDMVTGKIYDFSYRWYDSVTFEEPNNLLSEEDAFRSYLEKDGFDLIYEINTTYDKNKNIDKKNVRLVYNVNVNPAIISPFTGKQLNYDGSPYIKQDTKFNYKDIGEHEAARSIALLADMGIGFEGTEYKPNQAITQKELFSFLEKLNINNKIIKQELKENSTSSISRVKAAHLAIKILDLTKVAKMDIYKIEFADKSSIKKSDSGYIALVNGLGILKADKKNCFNPKDNLTRGQAADFIIGILSVS